jgi:hypothetical protein
VPALSWLRRRRHPRAPPNHDGDARREVRDVGATGTLERRFVTSSCNLRDDLPVTFRAFVRPMGPGGPAVDAVTRPAQRASSEAENPPNAKTPGHEGSTGRRGLGRVRRMGRAQWPSTERIAILNHPFRRLAPPSGFSDPIRPAGHGSMSSPITASCTTAVVVPEIGRSSKGQRSSAHLPAPGLVSGLPCAHPRAVR